MKTFRQKIGAESVVKKPPLGLMPRRFWEEKVVRERMHDICDAAVRYKNANEHVPQEWIEELMGLTSELLKIYAEAVATAVVDTDNRGQK